jgi:hypothetical protein
VRLSQLEALLGYGVVLLASAVMFFSQLQLIKHFQMLFEGYCNLTMYVCMYVRMYVCTYVRAYVRTYVCVCMYDNTCVCVCHDVCVLFVFVVSGAVAIVCTCILDLAKQVSLLCVHDSQLVC